MVQSATPYLLTAFVMCLLLHFSVKRWNLTGGLLTYSGWWNTSDDAQILNPSLERPPISSWRRWPSCASVSTPGPHWASVLEDGPSRATQPRRPAPPREATSVQSGPDCPQQLQNLGAQTDFCGPLRVCVSVMWADEYIVRTPFWGPGQR